MLMGPPYIHISFFPVNLSYDNLIIDQPMNLEGKKEKKILPTIRVTIRNVLGIFVLMTKRNSKNQS